MSGIRWVWGLAFLVAGACKPAVTPEAIPPVAPEVVVVNVGGNDEPTAEDKGVEREMVAGRSCPPAQMRVNERPTFARTRAKIELVRERLGAPSVAVGVGRAGQMVWADAFGFADKARRRRATADTMYSLASVSKPFTATGIMVLREQGKVRLDAPINTYLGEVGVHPGVGDPKLATVERVANHTAGLPLHYRFFYGGEVPSYEQTRRRFAVLVTEPGERYQYSNLGYGLLEQVIAKVSGQDYATFMQQEVFEPLQLRHTSVGPPSDRRRAAVRYSGSGEAVPQYRFDHDGASAIYSSARDLVAFGMTHLGFVRPEAKPLLSPESIARMREVQPPAKDYGLGWAVRRGQGQAVISHNGGMPGVRTALVLLPEHGVVIAVLINGEVGGAAGDLASAIAYDLGIPSQADAICSLPSDDPVLGRFVGQLDGPNGPQPMQLVIGHDGAVTATIGSGPELSVVEIRYDDAHLTGETFADIGARAAAGKPTDIVLDLNLRDDRLTGSVTAFVPGVAASTFFADLKKQ